MSTKRAAKRPAVEQEPSPSHDLHTEIVAARVLLATYRDILVDDEQAQADMVEGSTDLDGAMRRGIGRLAELRTMRDGLGATLKRLQSRDARFEQQERYLRVALQTALETAGRKNLETDLATISRARVPASVVVTNEEEIPSEYFVRAEPRLSKTKLRDALKEGKIVPGAEMSNGGETLHIHWS